MKIKLSILFALLFFFSCKESLVENNNSSFSMMEGTSPSSSINPDTQLESLFEEFSAENFHPENFALLKLDDLFSKMYGMISPYIKIMPISMDLMN